MESSGQNLPRGLFVVLSVTVMIYVVFVSRDALYSYVNIEYRPPGHSEGRHLGPRGHSEGRHPDSKITSTDSVPRLSSEKKTYGSQLKKICINYLWKDPVDFGKCGSKCEIVKDFARTKECQALVFEQAHMPRIKPPRMTNQVWIYLTHEPPVYSSTKWRKDFNWTMSFRRDSEIYFPWGIFMKRNSTLERDYDQVYNNKTGNIAWLVSNCHTDGKREVYMKQLKRYTSVDQVGRCGGTKCPRERTEKCRRELGLTHKFYFAFENSLCQDYTSEKAWLLYHYNLPIIPVTRGSTTVSTQLPNGTYINALDFSGPKELVEYLDKLGKDKDKYIAILKEKDKFTALDQPETFEMAMCTICEKITTNNIQPTNLDIVRWLKDGHCIRPNVKFRGIVE